eukprot:363500-Chlamydomonas_euryale.AAC.16
MKKAWPCVCPPARTGSYRPMRRPPLTTCRCRPAGTQGTLAAWLRQRPLLVCGLLKAEQPGVDRLGQSGLVWTARRGLKQTAGS